MHIVTFLLVACIGFATHWVVLLIAAIVYATFFPARYEMVLLGVALDLAMGVPQGWLAAPVAYTAMLSIIALGAANVRTYFALTPRS